MRHILLMSVLCFFISSNAFAQNMLFTFNPINTGSNIDSICAINLNLNEKICVNGTNQISLAITSADVNLTPEDVSIFPNPSIGETQLHFYSKQTDKIRIKLINFAGQVLTSETRSIDQGYHKFTILTQEQGVFLVQMETV